MDHLLEGAVFKAGKEVRITTQLIEAASDKHVWAESYRGSFTNLLELQDRIARSVVAQVIDKLAAGGAKAAVLETDPEAREACMMADYLLRRSQGEEEINRAKDYYLAAIEKDPRCADAYAGLTFTYFSLGGYGTGIGPAPNGSSRRCCCSIRTISTRSTGTHS